MQFNPSPLSTAKGYGQASVSAQNATAGAESVAGGAGSDSMFARLLGAQVTPAQKPNGMALVTAVSPSDHASKAGAATPPSESAPHAESQAAARGSAATAHDAWREQAAQTERNRQAMLRDSRLAAARSAPQPGKAPGEKPVDGGARKTASPGAEDPVSSKSERATDRDDDALEAAPEEGGHLMWLPWLNAPAVAPAESGGDVAGAAGDELAASVEACASTQAKTTTAAGAGAADLKSPGTGSAGRHSSLDTRLNGLSASSGGALAAVGGAGPSAALNPQVSGALLPASGRGAGDPASFAMSVQTMLATSTSAFLAGESGDALRSPLPAAAGPHAGNLAIDEVATAAGTWMANPGAAAPLTETPVVQIATPVQSPEFREVLGAQVSLLARDGVQEAQLQLNPAEMGPISVQITLDGSQARVDFGADSAATRQLIEAGLPELASALREAGLTLSGGGVSQHASGGRGDQGQPESGRTRLLSGETQGVAAVSAPARVVRSVAVGGVDLYA